MKFGQAIYFRCLRDISLDLASFLCLYVIVYHLHIVASFNFQHRLNMLKVL